MTIKACVSHVYCVRQDGLFVVYTFVLSLVFTVFLVSAVPETAGKILALFTGISPSCGVGGWGRFVW